MWGLRVPGGIGDRLTLRALYESHGRAIAVCDDAAEHAMHDLHRTRGHRCDRRGRRDACRTSHFARRRRDASRADRALQYGYFVEVRASDLGRMRVTRA